MSCDGSIYNIVDYSRLANHIEGEFGSKNFFGGDGTITFAVPDLRGEFLRGTGTNGATEISGSNVGYHQDGTEHWILWSSDVNGGGGGISIPTNIIASGGWYDSATNANSNVDSIIMGRVGYMEGLKFVNNPSTSLGATNTSRPTNTSVLFCIRW